MRAAVVCGNPESSAPLVIHEIFCVMTRPARGPICVTDPESFLLISALAVYLIGCLVTALRMESDDHDWGVLLALGLILLMPIFALGQWKRCSLGLSLCVIGLALLGASLLM